MRRRARRSRQRLALLLAPLFLIVLTTLAYGVLQDFTSLELRLAAGQPPTINLTSYLPNAQGNLVRISVNSATRIVEATEPTLPLIYMKVTNAGRTPIDRITLNNTIPQDWMLQQIRMQLIQADQTETEIDAPYFTVEYDQETNLATIRLNINNALGTTLKQDESIAVNIYLQYGFLGHELPIQYEINPPIYANTAATIAYIGNWQSETITDTLAFTTNTQEV